MPTYREWIYKIDIEIDYFSAFIKAWIAFNAWYRSEYSDRNDRDIIEKIKNESNRFRTYIGNFLDGRDSCSEEFRENVGNLHKALLDAAIVTQERGGTRIQILFTEIAVINPKQCAEADYRLTHYRIQRTGMKFVTEIHSRGTSVFRYEQDGYDEDTLSVHPDFIILSEERRSQCMANYKLVCPYITENILSSFETAKQLGNYGFINDNNKISRGIVEVLYLLRCSLMHGEVSPDKNAAEVYKYAYQILSSLLKKML